MTKEQKELIAVEVIRTLYNQLEKFPEDETNNRNAPFHEAFLQAFTEKLEDKVTSIPIFISLASWMHGLNTSLGQSFLEKTAHILCNGEKKEFTTKKRKALKISQNQKNSISNIITDLTNGQRIPDLEAENSELIANTNIEIDATDFTVDVFFQDSKQVVCIELKTVKPNKGVFKVEKEKILEAKIALKNLYPQKQIHYLLGFPFDPLNITPTGYNKQRYMDYSVGFRKYFDEKEFLIASELWDFLSGEVNTMETIIEIINNIATTKFLEIFEYINNFENAEKDKEKYLKSIEKWFLYSNCKIVNNLSHLKNKSLQDIKLQRILNQTLFDNSINYRFDRIQKLQSIY